MNIDHNVTEESANTAGPLTSAEESMSSTSSVMSGNSMRPRSKTTPITWQAALQATDDVTLLDESRHTCNHASLRLAVQAAFW